MTQRQTLETTNSALRQTTNARYFELAQRLAHVRLSHAQLDSSLFEPFGERFEFVWILFVHLVVWMVRVEMVVVEV